MGQDDNKEQMVGSDIGNRVTKTQDLFPFIGQYVTVTSWMYGRITRDTMLMTSVREHSDHVISMTEVRGKFRIHSENGQKPYAIQYNILTMLLDDFYGQMRSQDPNSEYFYIRQATPEENKTARRLHRPNRFTKYESNAHYKPS